jgi:hypothetical protein
LMLRTSFRSWRPPRFGLFYQEVHGLINNHLAKYVTMQVPTLPLSNFTNFTFPFRPNLCAFFVLPSHIRWTSKCRWLKYLVGFSSRPKPKTIKK